MAVDLSSPQFPQLSQRPAVPHAPLSAATVIHAIGAHLHRNHYRLQQGMIAADGHHFVAERGFIGRKDVNPLWQLCGSNDCDDGGDASGGASENTIFQCNLCGKRFKV
jgi:hypothetical protein